MCDGDEIVDNHRCRVHLFEISKKKSISTYFNRKRFKLYALRTPFLKEHPKRLNVKQLSGQLNAFKHLVQIIFSIISGDVKKHSKGIIKIISLEHSLS